MKSPLSMNTFQNDSGLLPELTWQPHTTRTDTVEIVYNEHEDQAGSYITGSRYKRYRYLYTRASTKTFHNGIWGVKKGIIVCK